MVVVNGYFEPGEQVQVFPVVDLVPRGKPVKTAKAKADGSVEVQGLEPGSYFLDGTKRVQVVVSDVGVASAPVDAPEVLSPEQIRERLAETRPADAGGEIVHGVRTTAHTRRRPAQAKAEPKSPRRRPAKGAEAKPKRRRVSLRKAK